MPALGHHVTYAPGVHPYYVGRPGSNGQRAAHFAIQQADLLLILGCRLSVSTIGYYPDQFAGNAFKIQVDVDQKELDKTDVPVDVKIRSTVQDFVKAAEGLPAVNSAEWTAHCQEMHAPDSHAGGDNGDVQAVAQPGNTLLVRPSTSQDQWFLGRGKLTDSSAVIVLSGQASSKLLKYEQETGIRQHGTQSLNLEPMVSSITKYFAAVMNPADIRYHMERARCAWAYSNKSYA